MPLFSARLGILALVAITLQPVGTVFGQATPAVEFAESIRPVLAENCGRCHNEQNAHENVHFLISQKVGDLQAHRGDWVKVAAQLRNRTMPPSESKLSENDRLRVANWIDAELLRTCCDAGDFAGVVAPRRLNRREYLLTVRDLLGVNFEVADMFPAENSAGAGFDTNGDTLYTPPLLIEKYFEAAQQIAESVIVTPLLNRSLTSKDFQTPVEPHLIGEAMVEQQNVSVPIYVTGRYVLRVTREGGDDPLKLNIDNLEAGVFATPAGLGGRGERGGRRGNAGRGQVRELEVTLERGTRLLTLVSSNGPVGVRSLSVEEVAVPVSPAKRALHHRLLGLEPGETPLNHRQAARQFLSRFLPKAYRRPVESAEATNLMAIYDRAADRGDPYEERIKLLLKAILVSPDFLFKMEVGHEEPRIFPLGQYELATRLSYFLWSTAPDEELIRLAAQGQLQSPEVLKQQVDRMLDDPRSRAFAAPFIGQWLGTENLGGRVAPLLNSSSDFYNAESAADLRAEPVRMLEYILAENRSLLELLDSDYSFLTQRLVKVYQLESHVTLTGTDFHKVTWPDRRRGGLLGMSAVLAIGSSRGQTSPVLRGAWALETLLGVQVPPPPPNIPTLEEVKAPGALTVRDKLKIHRENASCASCHNLMDPIGLGLENFDSIGRWRDKYSKGEPIDSSGVLPSGESFAGPEQLRQALLQKKEQFIRHLTSKMMGYALGRSMRDGDSCTIQHIVDQLTADGYRSRTLIHGIVLSIPFRNTQGGKVTDESVNHVTHRFKEKIVSCEEDGTCTPLRDNDKK